MPAQLPQSLSLLGYTNVTWQKGNAMWYRSTGYYMHNTSHQLGLLQAQQVCLLPLPLASFKIYHQVQGPIH